MNIKTLAVAGIEQSMKGMRNPMDSWHLQDTTGDIIGEKDLNLAQRLLKAGAEHAKFMCGLTWTCHVIGGVSLIHTTIIRKTVVQQCTNC